MDFFSPKVSEGSFTQYAQPASSSATGVSAAYNGLRSMGVIGTDLAAVRHAPDPQGLANRIWNSHILLPSFFHSLKNRVLFPKRTFLMLYVSSANMLHISQDSSLDGLGSLRVENQNIFGYM